MSAHDRLVALWDALEARDAHVDRIPLDTITAATANRLAATEERRLRILADELTSGPAATRSDTHHQIEDMVALVHHALTTKGDAA